MGKDVLVIGGGVVGLSVAYIAAAQGHRVRLIDGGTAESRGCSYGNAGMVVPSHFVPLAAPGMIGLALRCMLDPESPFYLKPRVSSALANWMWRFFRSANAAHVARAAPVLRDAHLASRALYEQWSRDWGDGFDLQENGLLLLCATAHGLEEEARVAEMGQALGIPSAVLTCKEAMLLEPSLRMDIEGAVYYSGDCHLSPQLLMPALMRQLEKASIAISWQTKVEGWRERGGRIVAVRTNRGELAADEFVLAAGVWSSKLAGALGLCLPMEAGKGYSLTIEAPSERPQHCAILSEARVAVTPMGDSLRFGGTMELAGLDSDITWGRVRGIASSVERYLPDFPPARFEKSRVWAGLRPCSPDGLPYIGRWPEPSNLIAATGHAMMGISLAPVSGQLVAEILADEEPSLPLDLLRPNRFATRHERRRAGFVEQPADVGAVSGL